MSLFAVFKGQNIFIEFRKTNIVLNFCVLIVIFVFPVKNERKK